MSETKNHKHDAPDPLQSEGPDVGETTTGAESSKGAGNKPARKKNNIGDLAQLLSAVYEGKFKRVSLKNAEIQTMMKSLEIEATERESILDLAATDRLLDKLVI